MGSASGLAPNRVKNLLGRAFPFVDGWIIVTALFDLSGPAQLLPDQLYSLRYRQGWADAAVIGPAAG
jgi:hypothetical protein